MTNSALRQRFTCDSQTHSECYAIQEPFEESSILRSTVEVGMLGILGICWLLEPLLCLASLYAVLLRSSASRSSGFTVSRSKPFLKFHKSRRRRSCVSSIRGDAVLEHDDEACKGSMCCQQNGSFGFAIERGSYSCG